MRKLKRNLSDGLVENAKDSFALGAEFFVQKSRKTYLKHTVLNLFHATELFLKARLAQVHPVLAYEKVDADIKGDSRTVSFQYAIKRLQNVDVEFTEEDLDNLKYIERLRNAIVHHHAEISSDEVQVYVARGLQFVDRFLRSQLKLTLESFLAAAEHTALKEVVYNYSERMKAILKKIDEDYKDDKEVRHELCWPCGERTVAVARRLVGSSTKCYFCSAQHKVYACHHCEAPCTHGECDKCATEREQEYQEAMMQDAYLDYVESQQE